MTIKGTLQVTKTNDYGFTAVKMGGAWYGADKKGFKPDAQEGDLVEFEAFANNKGYQTYKSATFKKVAQGNAQTSQPSADAGTSSVRSKPVVGANNGANRDTYWADKAKADEAKDPRIVYQSSYERAIAFTDLAIRNGAFEALGKAKPAAKLEILESFVNEQADRILSQVYQAAVPTAEATAKAANPVVVVENAEVEGDWA